MVFPSQSVSDHGLITDFFGFIRFLINKFLLNTKFVKTDEFVKKSERMLYDKYKPVWIIYGHHVYQFHHKFRSDIKKMFIS